MPPLRTAFGAQASPERSPSLAHPAPRWCRAFPALSMVGIFVLSLAFVPGLASASPGALTAGIPAPLPHGLLSLPDSYGTIPTGARALGPAAASTPVSFNLELNIPSTGPAANFVTEVNTPGSPIYHDYMTGAEYVSTYGASPSTIASLLSYLSSYGLSATPEGGIGLLYGVTGTAGEVDAALHTTMTTYQDGATTAMAPAVAPSLPDALAPWVLSLHNLNGLDLPKPTYELGPQTPATALTADNIEGAYNDSAIIASGVAGLDTIGLAEICDPGETANNYQSDLDQWDSANGLPALTLTLSGTGDTNATCSPGSSGWGLETDLDIQSSHSMAPKAPINVCLDQSDPSVCDSDFIADSIEIGSNSWTGPGPYTSIWQSAAAAGVTLFAAAGDACAAVNDPALEPDGIGVGGTSLTVSGNAWSSETVWSCSSGEGTGGGCDTSVAPPSYQVGMTGFPDASCGTSSDRGVPDVGADADPNTGLDIYTADGTSSGCGDPCQVGGTSLATPIWAASTDVIFQVSGFSGFFGPEVYAVAKSSCYSICFHDITSGSNGYAAQVGWDPDTGVGSPNIGAIANNMFTALQATLTPASTTVEAGTSVTLTTSATGGHPGYTYSWMLNGTVIASAPNSGVYTWVPAHPAAAPYVITCAVTDTAGDKTTAGPADVTVVPGPSVAYTASPLTADGGATITETAVASGGSGTGYQYSWSLNATTVLGVTTLGSFSWVAPNHTAIYQLGVKVTDSLGGSASASASISIYASPSLTLWVDPLRPIDIDQVVTLTANGTYGAPPTTFTFLSNGSTPILTPGTASSVPWAPTGAGDYLLSVRVADDVGKGAVSPQVPFTVNGDPEASIALPVPATVDVGQYVSVDARVAGGTAPFTYEWFVNSNRVNDLAGDYDFKPSSAGTYTFEVVINDTYGRSSTSAIVSLTVNPDPTVKLSGPASITAGASATVSATIAGGTSPYTVLWSINGTSVAGDEGDSVPFTEGSPGSFVVEAQVVDSVGYIVTVYKAVNVTATAELVLIPGTSPLESYVIIAAPILAVVALLAISSRRRKRDAKNAPPPGPGPAPVASLPTPAQGMLGPNVPTAMSPPAGGGVPELPPGQVPPPPAP